MHYQNIKRNWRIISIIVIVAIVFSCLNFFNYSNQIEDNVIATRNKITNNLSDNCVLESLFTQNRLCLKSFRDKNANLNISYKIAILMLCYIISIFCHANLYSIIIKICTFISKLITILIFIHKKDGKKPYFFIYI